jgi:hypothetical protein
VNTATALAQLTEAAEKYGTRSSGYRDRAQQILRALWQDGYNFGREQQS